MRLRFATPHNRRRGSFIPYPYPMNLTLAAISYGITVFALVLLAVRVRTLLAIYKKGAADPTRGNDKGTRLSMALREIFGHTKMFNFTVVGFAHWFVMIGFFSLFGTLITAYGQLIDPYLHFRLLVTSGFMNPSLSSLRGQQELELLH